MTRRVERSEILDYETYSERRESLRERMYRIKEPRRIHLGEYLTFLFENHDTIWYQIQEMVRAERIVKESAIEHEISTYNGLLAPKGSLSASLLIEIDQREKRAELLSAWLGLPARIYLRLEDGMKVYATFDPAQVGEDRLSAVQYLRFDTGGQVPAALGSDFEALRAETALTPDQRKALAEDLAED